MLKVMIHHILLWPWVTLIKCLINWPQAAILFNFLSSSLTGGQNRPEHLFPESHLPYFIEYNAHTSIVHIWISHWFLTKNYSIFQENFKRNNRFKFIHHKSKLKPFLSNLPCIVRREYFSTIINVKKCALYSIKYSSFMQ